MPPPEMYESKVLVEAACSGDPGAVDNLVERHLRGLERFVREHAGPVLRRKESAADLVQSACREVLGDLDSFRWRSEVHFRNWLYLTALRKIHDRTRYYGAARRDARRESSRPAVPRGESRRTLFDMYAQLGTPSEEAIAREQLDKMETTMRQLPEQYREVLMLSRILGMSNGEIAAELETTEANVRKIHSRASARLLRLLRDS